MLELANMVDHIVHTNKVNSRADGTINKTKAFRCLRQLILFRQLIMQTIPDYFIIH